MSKKIKVVVSSSWTHPISGKILPNGTELEIDEGYFNPSFLTKKTTKKAKK